LEKANKMMYRLQELQFAALELILFLDTHPYDQHIQHQISQIENQITLLIPKVEKYYGPLTYDDFARENPLRWIEEPWPWEIANY